MEQDFNIKHWANPCPKYNCRKETCKCGLKFVSISAMLGDDSENSDVAPKNGLYCNTMVKYESNGHIYIYSKEGIPVLVEKPIQTTTVRHLVINNLETATWTATGKEGEYSPEASYDRGSASSKDVEFKTNNGDILSVEDLYKAVAGGEKFTIDIPFGDIASKASVWDTYINMGTAKDVAFSAQTNTTINPPDENEVSFFLSSAAVMPIDHGGIVPYTLPFGVCRYNNDYEFIVTVLGYNFN